MTEFPELSHTPIRLVSETAERTEEIGAALAAALDENDSFIALYGGLGAGKTAFVRGLASVLTPGAYVHSPTYAIVNLYTNPDRSTQLAHMDLYRLEDDDDLYSIGCDEYMPDGKYRGDGIRRLAAVEWCENLPSVLPGRYIRVTIEGSGEETRFITIERAGGDCNIKNNDSISN